VSDDEIGGQPATRAEGEKLREVGLSMAGEKERVAPNMAEGHTTPQFLFHAKMSKESVAKYRCRDLIEWCMVLVRYV